MVLAALVTRGFDVSVPFGSGQPYDLIVDLGDRALLRVQCKTGWYAGGCIAFNCRSTDHGRGRQSYLGLADVLAVYFPPDRSIYLVPVADACGFNGRLRVSPPRSNQRRGVRFAADYAIDRWSREDLRGLVAGVRLRLVDDPVSLGAA